MKDLITFLKRTISESLYPTLEKLFSRTSDRIDNLGSKIDEKKEITINNPQDIVEPLKEASDSVVEAQKLTTEAVKNIPKVSIPELDVSGLERKIGEVKKTQTKLNTLMRI